MYLNKAQDSSSMSRVMNSAQRNLGKLPGGGNNVMEP